MGSAVQVYGHHCALQKWQLLCSTLPEGFLFGISSQAAHDEGEPRILWASDTTAQINATKLLWVWIHSHYKFPYHYMNIIYLFINVFTCAYKCIDFSKTMLSAWWFHLLIVYSYYYRHTSTEDFKTWWYLLAARLQQMNPVFIKIKEGKHRQRTHVSKSNLHKAVVSKK